MYEIRKITISGWLPNEFIMARCPVGQYWNGWECPLVNYQEFLKAMVYFSEYHKKENIPIEQQLGFCLDEYENPCFYYYEDGKKIIENLSNSWPEIEKEEDEIDAHFDISCGLVWEEYEEE